MQKPIRLSLLMTGSELMSGDITDSNSAFLGQFFSELNLTIQTKITVGDDLTQLCQALDYLSQHNDIVLINGGLGPTSDDLTAQALAQFGKQTLALHPDAEQHVRAWCQKRHYEANAANLKQALLPQTAQIFKDAPGSAPAFYLTINHCLFIATPGVPFELKTICQQAIADFLKQSFCLKPQNQWQRFCLFGIGESSLQEKIKQQHRCLNDDFIVGFRAYFPYLELKLKAKTEQANQVLVDALVHDLENYIIGPANTTMAGALVKTLQEQNQTISTAESCTGGLIASQITQIAGVSSVFPGSIVSYNNAIKNQLLHVPDSLLKEHGAVSEAVASAMLNSALQQFQSTYAIAVSGIAGPTGGTKNKPVGTVCIAWGTQTQQNVIRLLIPQARQSFQELTCCIALDLVRRQALKLPTPNYLNRWQAAN